MIAKPTRVWTVSEVKAGTLTQCLGVARHFDEAPHSVIVSKSLPRWKAPFYRLPFRLPSPPPDMIVSCGGKAQSHVMAIRAAMPHRPRTVHLANPGPEYRDRFDLAFVSRHDWTEEYEAMGNLRKMVGVPHRVTAREIEMLRPAARLRWVGEGRRAVTVLVGGQNRAYLYDAPTIDRIVETISGLGRSGAVVLVSTSRRSDPTILQRLLALRSDTIRVWDRTGENPYREFLAAADAFIVTKDSVTMLCEALVTGKPTFSLELKRNPCPRLTKFERFHHDMSETLRLTRPWNGDILDYVYVPLAEAERIAGEIERAWPDLTRRPVPS